MVYKCFDKKFKGSGIINEPNYQFTNELHKDNPVDNKENTTFDDHLVSEELNKFFENATRGLEINENPYIIDTDINKINSVEKAINKYRNYLSVLLIKTTLKNIHRNKLI